MIFITLCYMNNFTVIKNDKHLSVDIFFQFCLADITKQSSVLITTGDFQSLNVKMGNLSKTMQT